MPSGYSVLEYQGDGVTTVFAVNFTLGYLKKSDIYCRVGTEVDGSGNPAYRTLESIPGDTGRMRVLGAVPTASQKVLFRRITSKTVLQNDYADGEALDDDALDNSFKQALMIAHELLDGFGLSTVYSDIDLTQHKIINVVTDPNDPTSMCNVQYAGQAPLHSAAALAAQVASEAARDTSIAAKDQSVQAAADAEVARAAAVVAKVGAEAAAAIVNPSAYARSIGGNAYKNILGIVCPPSLEVMAYDHQGAVNGVPPGFTFSRASTATAYGADGALYTAAAGELRHECDALTGEYKGWLLEGQATNLLIHSEDFTNAAWNKVNVSTATASRLQATSTNSTAYQNVSISADTQTRCYSWRVKKTSTSTAVRLLAQAYGGTTQVYAVTLNPSTGALSSVSVGGAYGVIDIGDAWLVYMTLTNNGTNTGVQLQVQPDVSAGTGYADMAGVQIEVGSYPTSYIPTTSAQVTRAADSLSLATSAFPFNAAEGTLYAEASEYSNTNAGYPFIASLDGGSTDYQIGFFAVPSSAQIKGQVFDGALMAQISTASPSVGAFGRHAMAWKVNDFAACGNGGTVGTYTLGTVPAVTTLQIGAVSTGAEAWFGHIRHIVYFPRRLSNTELQLLTK